ncbi:MAG: GNAT family N-acetyltransferase [Bacilli bacterium]|nr:GNAT family N-acetyltransferase [Bacilli bacterium]
MNVEFKIAEYNDIDDIIKLCNECFKENTNLEYARKIFKDNEFDKNQIYLIGILNNEIVAHAKINIIPTIYEDMNTYAILNHVCVKEEYRREHIGTKLLDECFKIAKEKKCKCVELWSKNFRKAAHELYHSYGFEVMDAKFFTKNID